MLFFSAEIPEGNWKLNEEESRHIKVLRLRDGDEIQVTDGKGHLATCVLIKVDKSCTLQTSHIELHASLAPKIHLYVAPTKNSDRMEWLVEKAVEIGVASITFLVCENSERTHQKPDRIERVAISAMKQSLQYHLPQMQFDIKFLSAWNDAPGFKLLAHCEEGEKILLSTWEEDHHELSIFIGPEGDFSPSEIANAKSHRALSLGQTRLRTETAALKALIAAHEYIERHF
jgi:16S rRNA (uracil1498-N3)-methyltransferase